MSIESIVGATILRIEGLKVGSEDMRIVTDKGTMRLWHERNCCESVEVEDIFGSTEDVIGRVVRVAEEREEPQPCLNGYEEWTFYEIRTDGGDLTIRWCGCCHNGHYSIAVGAKWTPCR